MWRQLAGRYCMCACLDMKMRALTHCTTCQSNTNSNLHTRGVLDTDIVHAIIGGTLPRVGAGAVQRVRLLEPQRNDGMVIGVGVRVS